MRGRRRQRGGGWDAGGREKKEGMSRGEKKPNDSTAENTLFVKDAYSSLKRPNVSFTLWQCCISDQHMEFYVSQIPLRRDFLYLHHFLFIKNSQKLRLYSGKDPEKSSPFP